jgi:hypothetical protein
MKPEISRQVVERYSNAKFQETLTLGAQLFHADGRTDGQINDEANSRVSQF